MSDLSVMAVCWWFLLRFTLWHMKTTYTRTCRRICQSHQHVSNCRDWWLVTYYYWSVLSPEIRLFLSDARQLDCICTDAWSLDHTVLCIICIIITDVHFADVLLKMLSSAVIQWWYIEYLFYCWFIHK